MKFQKGLSKELCAMLERDLQQYTKEITMNEDERLELCLWVQTGHSPYDNGWGVAADDGTPMDYISAKQFVEGGGTLIPAYDTVNDEPSFLIRDDIDEAGAEDIPF